MLVVVFMSKLRWPNAASRADFKVEWIALFHPQLLDCTKKFTEKDQSEKELVAASGFGHSVILEAGGARMYVQERNK